MCIISIDRYFAVVYPLGQRITTTFAFTLVLCIMWLVSFTLALPMAYYNEVAEIHIYIHHMVRCRAKYPSADTSKWITVFAFATQYFIPLAIASMAYCSIAFHINKRSKLGAMTPDQIENIIR